jgi:hypothetical protein
MQHTRPQLILPRAVVVTEARPLARELVGRRRHPLALDARERRVGVGAVRDVARVEARDIARVQVAAGHRSAARKRNVVRRIKGRRRPVTANMHFACRGRQLRTESGRQ